MRDLVLILHQLKNKLVSDNSFVPPAETSDSGGAKDEVNRARGHSCRVKKRGGGRTSPIGGKVQGPR